MNQLGLDGTEVAHPVHQPRRLTGDQRDVVTFVRAFGLVTPSDVGTFLGGDPRWVANRGWDMLHRLQSRGLVKRRRRGLYELVEHSENWTAEFLAREDWP
jgi:hypothetical protein